MKKLKKILILLVPVLFLFACTTENDGASTGGETDGTSETKEAGDITIGYSVSTLNNPAFVFLTEEMEKNAKELGIEISVSDSQNDSSVQANAMDDFITQGVDAIIVNPVDSAAITPSVESANAAGIPVITVDRSSDGGEILASIVSDNVLGGELAAQYLVDTVGEGSAVAVVEGIPGASATQERTEGFTNIADDMLDVVASQAGNFDRADSLTVTENILQSNPEIVAIFAQNDESALGVYEAVTAAGRDEIVIIGFDGAELALESIKDGNLDATIGQRFDLMAELAVQAVLDYYQGKEVDQDILAPVELITQNN